MKNLKKIALGTKSIFVKLKYKLIYRNALCIGWQNSIRGKLYIEILGSGKIVVGKYLMARGPLYLKCSENAQLVIGNNCFFNNNCSITSAESIKIGNSCMFANNLVIVDHDHKRVRGKATSKLISKPIVIEDNVWIGANATILKGVTIGKGAIVAAGAVVRKNVPSYSIVGGVPARLL